MAENIILRCKYLKYLERLARKPANIEATMKVDFVECEIRLFIKRVIKTILVTSLVRNWLDSFSDFHRDVSYRRRRLIKNEQEIDLP